MCACVCFANVKERLIGLSLWRVFSPPTRPLSQRGVVTPLKTVIGYQSNPRGFDWLRNKTLRREAETEPSSESSAAVLRPPSPETRSRPLRRDGVLLLQEIQKKVAGKRGTGADDNHRRNYDEGQRGSPWQQRGGGTEAVQLGPEGEGKELWLTSAPQLT